MRSQRQLSVSIPIPPNLPPEVVITALQTFKPIIMHLGSFQRFEILPTKAESTADDPFFRPGCEDLYSYQIYELLTLAPGISKEVTYQCHFQPIHGGSRCRAEGNAGIRGWVEFSVRPKREPSSPDGSISTPSTDLDEWELCEVVVVEGNSLLMPFIATTVYVSHKGLCNKILDEVMQNYFKGYDYSAETHPPTTA